MAPLNITVLSALAVDRDAAALCIGGVGGGGGTAFTRLGTTSDGNHCAAVKWPGQRDSFRSTPTPQSEVVPFHCLMVASFQPPKDFQS